MVQSPPWLWTFGFEYHEDRTPTHGYAATREAAMAAFGKSWRQEAHLLSLVATCRPVSLSMANS
jgi:hypothetical protein